jgi:competence protein ComEA
MADYMDDDEDEMSMDEVEINPDSDEMSMDTNQDEDRGVVEEDIVIEENVTESSDELINLNNATKDDLMMVPGIAESSAEAIIKYREKNGRFENLQELSKVSGLRKENIQTLKKWVTI